ncbi:hypothetical protein CVT25_012006 [Psilocybe cyanescens]|uniref:Uncharacterized protein n=1 Tax=Psilocybe cyanescens TaxID=93625 RepID=A0A409XFD5_PSICY|nr:hypothetical protein CVT25_012006 [Psilocybe cyanescens]
MYGPLYYNDVMAIMLHGSFGIICKFLQNYAVLPWLYCETGGLGPMEALTQADFSSAYLRNQLFYLGVPPGFTFGIAVVDNAGGLPVANTINSFARVDTISLINL